MAKKNFSSKRLIQDTGRKMGLATTVKRAQDRDPSEKTFFDKKRGKELAAVSKEDMKDAGFTSFGKDSLGKYLNMKKKLGRKPTKKDFIKEPSQFQKAVKKSQTKAIQSKIKKRAKSAISSANKPNPNDPSYNVKKLKKTPKKEKSLIGIAGKQYTPSPRKTIKAKDKNPELEKKKSNIGIAGKQYTPKKKQSVITSSYNRKPNTGAMSYRKKGGDLFVSKQYGGKII